MPEGKTVELNAHDITRIWSLAILLYDGSDDDADLRESFIESMGIYHEMMKDITEGGSDYEDGEFLYVSSREVGPHGDTIRFTPKPKPPPKPAPPKSGSKAKGKR
jgi:hypothetical protein